MVAHTAGSASEDGLAQVRGMTVSCQTWGIEWGTHAFVTELEELAEIGVNWVAIHPYASIRADGEVRWRPLDPTAPPQWLERPIREAHARGFGILIKPHLAYWGSPFEWRGSIDFPEPADRDRFWSTYSEWIVQLAATCREADAFAIGTELALLEGDVDQWRGLAGRVRERTDGLLTYAANWDTFERVAFWDALDCVGIQGYFPLAQGEELDAAAARLPNRERLVAAWDPHFQAMYRVHQRTGKPVVFTEVGFTQSSMAAVEPWSAHREQTELALETQRRCLEATLLAIEASEEWFRGAFLWKCFPGPSRSTDFALEGPELRGLIQTVWAGDAPGRR
ncbi:MAG: hypothetical protein AAFZ65_08455 [Planctomycetota bacterium]